MDNVKLIVMYIISLLSGGGTSYWCWEKFYDAVLAILVGSIVSIISIISGHYIIEYFDYKKKYKHKK